MSIPRSMRAAILVEQRKPLIVADIELPRALEVGQVLVRIHCSGICGSQLGEIDGAKGEDKFLPHLLGHEGSGVVIEVGPGVRHVKAGDQRRSALAQGSGHRKRCRRNISGTEEGQNAGWVTTFNEYAIVSENRVTAIPADSDPEIAALFGCAVTTGFGVVVNDARRRSANLSSSMAQAASASISFRLPRLFLPIRSSRSTFTTTKLEFARSLGATHTINGTHRMRRTRSARWSAQAAPMSSSTIPAIPRSSARL